MTGINIDRVHYTAAMSLTTAEIVDAWHKHLARVKMAQDELACLTPIQREVLIYIAKGFNSREIGKLIERSGKTVDLHAMKIREALGMTTFECVTAAIRAEWV